MPLMTAFGVVYITQGHEKQSPEINLLLLVSKGMRFTSRHAFALKMCWHSFFETHVTNINEVLICSECITLGISQHLAHKQISYQ